MLKSPIRGKKAIYAAKYPWKIGNYIIAQIFYVVSRNLSSKSFNFQLLQSEQALMRAGQTDQPIILLHF